MKIWIFQTGEPIHIDKAGLRPMRAINLSNALVKSGHEVVIWSSNLIIFQRHIDLIQKMILKYQKHSKLN